MVAHGDGSRRVCGGSCAVPGPFVALPVVRCSRSRRRSRWAALPRVRHAVHVSRFRLIRPPRDQTHVGGDHFLPVRAPRVDAAGVEHLLIHLDAGLVGVEHGLTPVAGHEAPAFRNAPTASPAATRGLKHSTAAVTRPSIRNGTTKTRRTAQVDTGLLLENWSTARMFGSSGPNGNQAPARAYCKNPSTRRRVLN